MGALLRDEELGALLRGDVPPIARFVILRLLLTPEQSGSWPP